MSTIERRSQVSLEEFVADYLVPLRPVVLEDVVPAWGNVMKWDLDYLASRAGHRFVEVSGVRTPFGKYLERLSTHLPSNPAPYLVATSIVQLLPELLPDMLPYPDVARHNWFGSRYMPNCVQWGAGREFGYPEILVGGQGSSFPVLHYDVAHVHAFIAQVRGEKEFFIYGPEQTPFLYPDPERPNDSLVRDVHNPDLARYPLFAQATPSVVTLKPGDLLFVPSGFWHITRLKSLSIGFTLNSVSRSNWDNFTSDVVDRIREHIPELSSFYTIEALRGIGTLMESELPVRPR